MSWAGHDAVAYALFAPAALAGALAPQLLAPALLRRAQRGASRPALGPRDGVAGAACGAAAAAAALAAAGLGSAFVFAAWAAAALASLLAPLKARRRSHCAAIWVMHRGGACRLNRVPSRPGAALPGAARAVFLPARRALPARDKLVPVERGRAASTAHMRMARLSAQGTGCCAAQVGASAARAPHRGWAPRAAGPAWAGCPASVLPVAAPQDVGQCCAGVALKGANRECPVRARADVCGAAGIARGGAGLGARVRGAGRAAGRAGGARADAARHPEGRRAPPPGHSPHRCAAPPGHASRPISSRLAGHSRTQHAGSLCSRLPPLC